MDCYPQMPQTGGLETTEAGFSQFRRLGSPRSGCPQGWVPEGALSGLQKAIFSLCYHMGGLYKHRLHSCRLLPGDLVKSQRPRFLVPSLWGLGFAIRILEAPRPSGHSRWDLGLGEKVIRRVS